MGAAACVRGVYLQAGSAPLRWLHQRGWSIIQRAAMHCRARWVSSKAPRGDTVQN